jgi:hypothetical protein
MRARDRKVSVEEKKEKSETPQEFDYSRNQQSHKNPVCSSEHRRD